MVADHSCTHAKTETAVSTTLQESGAASSVPSSTVSSCHEPAKQSCTVRAFHPTQVSDPVVSTLKKNNKTFEPFFGAELSQTLGQDNSPALEHDSSLFSETVANLVPSSARD